MTWSVFAWAQLVRRCPVCLAMMSYGDTVERAWHLGEEDAAGVDGAGAVARALAPYMGSRQL